MKRPTPAITVAVVALIAAASGSAIASSNKPRKHHGDAAADRKLIRKLAPALSVKFATAAGSAATASTADHAASADHAANDERERLGDPRDRPVRHPGR
jgi:hypothetical protein